MYQGRPRYNNRPRGRNFARGGGGGRRIKTFDPSFLIHKSTSGVSTEDVVHLIKHNSFDEFNLSNELKSSLKRNNFEKPTLIQDQAIPEILNGRDLVGISNTGTGKTAAYLLPLIDKVQRDNKSKVLIIAPTRELAVQIADDLRSFASNVRSVVCIGGTSIGRQSSGMHSNPRFVIGTPGRLDDLAKRRVLHFSWFDTVVLDEVDRMLDMGFVHEIKKMIGQLPKVRQSLFFSATLDSRTRSIMNDLLTDPVSVSVQSEEAGTHISQEIVKTVGRDKKHVLVEVLDNREVTKSLVFVRTKRGADSLSKLLLDKGFKAAVMHGNKSQHQRQKSLELFRQGSVSTLIATDVASRGIDVDDITHVINYDLPESKESYIHRIGRTGRLGKKGVALSFIE